MVPSLLVGYVEYWPYGRFYAKNTGYTVVNKTDFVFALMQHIVLWERESIQENNQMNMNI